MDKINQIIDWIFAAWITFSDWVNSKPMPDVPAYVDATRWFALGLAVLSIVLVAAYFWIVKITRPYIDACRKREVEHAEALRKFHEQEYAHPQSGNDLG